MVQDAVSSGSSHGKGHVGMTTTVLKPVIEDSRYTVRFTNAAGSTGSVLVVVAWVPKHGQPVPAAQQMLVAPSSPPGELKGVVPDFSKARRMVIVASLDPGESGRLELLQNDAPHKSEHIAKTTTWESLVVPKRP
jgi:hypothetical protein